MNRSDHMTSRFSHLLVQTPIPPIFRDNLLSRPQPYTPLFSDLYQHMFLHFLLLSVQHRMECWTHDSFPQQLFYSYSTYNYRSRLLSHVPYLSLFPIFGWTL
jgi:hypothetical protein